MHSHQTGSLLLHYILFFAQGGIHFCEEQTLLYPAGCGVARVRVDNSGNGGQQDLVLNRTFSNILQNQEVPINISRIYYGQVPMVNKGAKITAIALNPTRQLLAFTERGERPLLVQILTQEKRRNV